MLAVLEASAKRRRMKLLGEGRSGLIMRRTRRKIYRVCVFRGAWGSPTWTWTSHRTSFFCREAWVDPDDLILPSARWYALSWKLERRGTPFLGEAPRGQVSACSSYETFRFLIQFSVFRTEEIENFRSFLTMVWFDNIWSESTTFIFNMFRASTQWPFQLKPFAIFIVKRRIF